MFFCFLRFFHPYAAGHGCKRQNAGKKVRCGGCQRWRGGGRPDVAARKAEKLLNPHGHWFCDGCGRSNKASKVRCGGCQRWRGGERPNLRKRQAPAVGITAAPGQYPFHAPMASIFPTHAPPMSHISGTQPPVVDQIQVAHQIAAVSQATMPNQVPMTSIPISVPNQVTLVSTQTMAQNEPPMIKNEAPATNLETTNDGAWTCDKCTCDNLPTETRCKICEAPRPLANEMVQTV